MSERTAEDDVAIRLPAAPPSSYLRWTAFGRDVEEAMASHPDLEREASGPFLHGEVATFISEHLVRSLAYQAIEAQRRSEDQEFSPVLRGPRPLLAATAGYVERRGRYLQAAAGHVAGIDALDADLVELRARTVAAIRDQLGSTGPMR